MGVRGWGVGVGNGDGRGGWEFGDFNKGPQLLFYSQSFFFFDILKNKSSPT